MLEMLQLDRSLAVVSHGALMSCVVGTVPDGTWFLKHGPTGFCWCSIISRHFPVELLRNLMESISKETAE